jgi:hypothetical protein
VKSFEVLHTSFAVYCAVIVVTLLFLIGLEVTRPGARGYLTRPGRCAIAGALAAAALDIYVDTKRHAQLVKEAARHHVTVTYLLADGFGFVFVIVTVLGLIAAAMAAGRRRRPAARASASRPRAGAGMWPS